MIRREFLTAAAAGLSGSVVAGVAGAQQQTSAPRSNVMGPMDDGAYRPVRLPAKTGGSPLPREERDSIEYRLGCQCGCSLSVYVCRTTDFTCPVSPAMHRDINALGDAGHSAEEIIAAFTGVYGEKVLLAPPRRGFNWLAYLLPFAVMAIGLVVVTTVVRRLRTGPTAAGPMAAPTDATPDELARVQASVRDESA